jgi:hypothetical protein
MIALNMPYDCFATFYESNAIIWNDFKTMKEKADSACLLFAVSP